MDSLNGMNGIAPMSRGDSEEFMKQSSKLKPVFIQAIDEVVGELETTHEDVAKGAKEHVHSTWEKPPRNSTPANDKGREVILTLGYSKTAEAFLKQAFRDRKFTVIVAESAPSYVKPLLQKAELIPVEAI